MHYPEVRLAPGRETRLAAGHPWIYRTEVAKGEAAPGDVVRVLTSRGRFLALGLYNPHSQLTVRLLTRREDAAIDRDFWRQRLSHALEWRRRLLPGVEAYRAVFAEADGFPGLIVDDFAGVLVVQFLSLGLDARKLELAGLLAESLSPECIYERSDAPVRRLEGLAEAAGPLLGECPERVSINEHGLRFDVDVQRGQKTGFYLDQRENRAAIAPYCPGARVLDCFAHTGGFALHAALYGAREVTAVEASAEACALGREHAAANGLDGSVTFVTANAFDELRRLVAAKEQYDLVILDPPAFAHRREAVPGALRGYKEINLRGLRLVRGGGFLVTCSCSGHVTADLFHDMLRSALADSGRRARVAEIRSQAVDHPVLLGVGEARYLKFFAIQVTE
ncbi:MAG: class I SAM-dependent rRNA methyltransferase [Bacillota bacterium]